MASEEVVALLNYCCSWWAEYCELKRKFGMEGGSHATWRNYVRDLHEERWQEEVGGKSSVKWYRLAKENFGEERYAKELVAREK